MTRAPAERQINTFKEPYDQLLTPYQNRDFNELVKKFCKQAQSGICLKIGKVIFIGDTGVGKTSLIKRFCNKTFEGDYRATIGIDFEVEGFDVLGVPFNIQIWDTAGQERFKWISSSYYRGTNVIVIVFDLSKISSLANCGHWLDEAMQGNSPSYVFLVGNKLDTVSSSTYEGIKQIVSPVAHKLNAEYWPVSCKNGKNVKALFLRIAFLAFESVILKEMLDRNDLSEASIKLNQDEIKKGRCAC